MTFSNPQDDDFLYTHQHAYDLDAPTLPLTVVTVPNPVHVAEPMDPVVEVYSHGKDAELSSREAMWGLMIFGGLAPIIGVFSAGFLGFVFGTLIGLTLGILGSIVRHNRIKAIRDGRTDLAFSNREVVVETGLGVALSLLAGAQLIGHLERKHAQHIGEAVARAQHPNDWYRG